MTDRTRAPTVGGSAHGRVRSVRGNVVDVAFESSVAPVGHELRTGDDGEVVLEVVEHPSEHAARCIAMTPTRGLARGEAVRATGHPLRAPVGEGA